MGLQDQVQERQIAQKLDKKPAEYRHELERERLNAVGLTAREVLAGCSLQECPLEQLEQLAGWIGNQSMLELFQAQGPPLEETEFRQPVGEPWTEPYPVPESQPQLADPRELTESTAGRAFDPIYLL